MPRFRGPGDELTAGADRLLWSAMRQGWSWTGTLLVTSLASTAAALALPTVFGAAVDGQLRDTGSAVALWWFGALLAVLVGCEVLGQIAAPLATAAAARWLRHRLFRHVLALGLPGRDRFAPGDVASRLMGGTSEAAAVGPTAVGAVSSLLAASGGLVGLAMVDGWLAATFLLGVPIGVVVTTRFVSTMSGLSAGYLAAYANVSSRLVEALAGVRTIRSSGTVDREIARVLAPASDLARLGHATWRAYALVGWRSTLLTPAIQLAVLSVAGYGMAAGRITPGQFLAALGYTSLALGFLGQAGVLAALGRARGGARSLHEILDCRPMRCGLAQLPSGPGELRLRGVTVLAGERRILDRLDLTVPAGHCVAVVGGSAAGKSTLGAVAGRLIEPAEGTVWLDGVPLDTLSPAELRRAVGFAFERPALLGRTVADMIALGSGPVGRDRIEWAARTAQADRFVRRLPQGYDTGLDQRPMSGGEAQRLGIARALVADKRLLILDDATSSVDTVTEALVCDALTDSLAGRTRIVIAHRAATAARCDLVAWLDDGRIRAVAPHQVLCRNPGYRALFGQAGPA